MARDVLFSLLLTAMAWDWALCSLGEGRRQWYQPPTSEPFKQNQSFLHGTFLPGFLWGTGTSAFQTEGAWDRDGKGPSIWDHFTHSAADHGDGGAADMASESYVHWEEDIEALGYLGVRSYAFSLSWPRIFPNGSAVGQPNVAAVEHYGRLIDRLLERGIEPLVTLFHWDLPQALQEHYGGWRNEALVGLFDAYATFCFRTYGDRVRHWITIHNPYLVSVQGYGTGVHAPGETGDPSTPFTVAHNLIRAHAKVWHTYDTHFRPTQKGQVSLVLGSHWMEPQKGQATSANVELCQQSIEAVLGWFANPIFGEGDYPASMKSTHKGLMPEFTPEEKLWVRGTADFFSLSFGPNNLRLGHILARYGQLVFPDLRRLLGWVRLEYGDLPVLVAEVGWFSDAAVETEDTIAVYLMKRFINQVLQATVFDGVRVFGYTAWSLVDGFEWDYGYGVRRGLFYVDFDQGSNRTRFPKTTAQFYRQVVKDNGFPSDETTPEVKGHFPCDFHWGVADSTVQVHFHPNSPQFMDPHLYIWNLTGDGALHPIQGVKLHTKGAQCTDYLAIRGQLGLFASVGASQYRFALNWSLILPNGDLSRVDTEALRYYRCLLTELRKKGLEAMVTLYHPTHRAPWLGLPGPLHNSGGWLNRSTVDAYQSYVTLCYRELGPWVNYWITINEPNRLVDAYKGGGEQHMAAHHLLLAHARAWSLYDREYLSLQGGLVSLSLHADWAEPANPFLESHAFATQRFLLFELGRFLDPILGGREAGGESGDYPTELRRYLEERARVAGLPGSPLPRFTDQERQELRGALGFIALNHFTTRLVSPRPHSSETDPADPHELQPPDHDCLLMSDPTWDFSGLGQAVVPWGLRRVLRWVKDRYGGSLPVIVTASGVDDQASTDDLLRQHYIRSYLQEALKARQLDGVNLKGFYVYKLQDRDTPRFGLFTSSQHQSRPKSSIAVYRKILDQSGFPGNNVTSYCRVRNLRMTCTICAQMSENKPLLFFAGCLVLTFTMLVAVITVAVRRKSGARGRVGAPVCPFPLGMKSQPWERVTLQCVTDRTSVARR
ncbi:beta-klotho [Esox lucius]|uniref:Klotho beta n=1 Tax=Esox lucius TaxID=8010 RepID=A0A3P8YSR9_ESOLU|nr:beta-klotho [Esox lucius]